MYQSSFFIKTLKMWHITKVNSPLLVLLVLRKHIFNTFGWELLPYDMYLLVLIKPFGAMEKRLSNTIYMIFKHWRQLNYCPWFLFFFLLNFLGQHIWVTLQPWLSSCSPFEMLQIVNISVLKYCSSRTLKTESSHCFRTVNWEQNYK